MAQAPIRNLSVEQGTDFIVDFFVTDPQSQAIDFVAGSAIARMKVKNGYGLGARTFMDMSSEDAVPFLVFHREGVVGRVSIVIPDTATASSTFVNNDSVLELLYDLEIEMPSTFGTLRLCKGDFLLHKELTD